MILDIGCGQHPISKAIHLDVNKGSKHLDVLASIYNLPFNENSFQAVHCSNVFEHLKDPFKALQEVHRVSRRAYIKVPNSKYYTWKTSDSNNEHLYSWNRWTLYNFLKLKYTMVFISESIRQIVKPNMKYKLFLALVSALFDRSNELLAECWK